MLVFCGVLFCVNFFFCVCYWFFFLLFWLSPFFENQIVWFGFVFRLFAVLLFLFRLVNSLQKNNLSSS